MSQLTQLTLNNRVIARDFAWLSVTEINKIEIVKERFHVALFKEIVDAGRRPGDLQLRHQRPPPPVSLKLSGLCFNVGGPAPTRRCKSPNYPAFC
jgi:hypothetical protein